MNSKYFCEEQLVDDVLASWVGSASVTLHPTPAPSPERYNKPRGSEQFRQAEEENKGNILFSKGLEWCYPETEGGKR